MPEGVLYRPAVAQGFGGVVLQVLRRKFRAFFPLDFLQFKACEEFTPFLFQASCRGQVIRGRKGEGVDAVPAPGDQAYRLVGRVVTLAYDVEEGSRGAEGLFGVGFGQGRLLAAGLETLHLDAGPVHQVHGFALGKGHFPKHRPTAGAGVVEFVGGSVFAADHGPVATGILEAVTLGIQGRGACRLMFWTL